MTGPRLLAVIGTRPEAIKMAPVILEARRRSFEIDLIATGQHGALLDQALTPFGLVADQSPLLPSLGKSPEQDAVEIEKHLSELFGNFRPDLVLVQGDTTSALAAARAALGRGIAVGHIEAGLRSHDLEQPYPEEGNRIAIDRLSSLLFAPTRGAMANLAEDPAVSGTAHLTGNSGIDALLHIRRTLPTPIPRRTGRRQLLVTLHRREVIGDPLRGICAAFRSIADRGDTEITLPLHPNPNVRSILCDRLEDHRAIALIPPLDYPAMIARMAASDLILSDSGGIQEEAPALGVPLLILRDVTERPEAITCGAALLGTTDPHEIFRHASHLLEDETALRRMARPRFPFGRGDAAKKIMTVIEKSFGTDRVTF